MERRCSTGCGTIIPRERKCNRCRDCQREYMAHWREQNREAYNRYQADYRTGVRRSACRRCANQLPAGRRWLLCADCGRSDLRQWAQIPGRKCSGGCGASLPVGRLSRYCIACVRSDWRCRIQRSDRRCAAHCGAVLPAGRQNSYCLDCTRIYHRRNAQKPRSCSQCGDPVPRGWTAYLCRDCRSICGVEDRAKKRAAARAS